MPHEGWTMAWDIGWTNCGVDVYDGKSMLVARVNLAVQEVRRNGRAATVKLKMQPQYFVRVVEAFVHSNHELMLKVHKVPIEIQKRSVMKELSQCIAGFIQGRYPHTYVYFVSPVRTRAEMNTRVLDEPGGSRKKYALRKKLSVAALPKLFGAEGARKVRAKFGAKLDDAAEAAILAAYAHHTPVPDVELSGKPTTDPVMVSLRLPVAFSRLEDLELTVAEREAVLRPARKGLPKPRKRASTSAPAGEPRKKARRGK